MPLLRLRFAEKSICPAILRFAAIYCLKAACWIFLLLPLGATAQSYPQYWVANHFMGLRIEQDTVVPFVSQCNMYTSQISPNGCGGEPFAAYTLDSLHFFYAGAKEIFNQDGLRPLNSILQFNEPEDGVSECNGTILLPVPGQDSLLFWVVNQTSAMNGTLGMYTNNNFGLKYSVINVNGNGGLGEIPATQKEIYLLREQTTERVMAIQHANGQDWWIMVNDHDSGEFSIFRTDGDSIVFSHHYAHPALRYHKGGFLRGVGEYDYHYPTGTLVFCSLNEGLFIFHFDPCTGSIYLEGHPHVREKQYDGYVGMALSENGRYAYLSGDRKDLVQVELNANADTLDPVYMFNADTLPPGPQSYFGGLERAPDGKIYFARSGACPFPLNFSGSIGCIVNPDLPFPGCNVQVDLYSQPQWRIYSALPNMPKYVPYAGIQAGTITASTAAGCPGTTVTFSHNSCGQLGQAWDFGDGSPLDSSEVASHTYQQPGDHIVRLYLWHGNERDTVEFNAVQIADCITSDFLALGATGCLPLEVQFQSSMTGNVAGFAWDFGDGRLDSVRTAPTHNYFAPGSYTVTLRAWNATEADTATQVGVVQVEDCGQYFTVSPNPSPGLLHVRYWQAGAARIHADIYDMLGHKVARQTFAGGYGDHVWDVSTLADAPYVLRVVREDAPLLHLKLVIQK
jgi:hypothetical protein